jgi:hypothetical protein
MRLTTGRLFGLSDNHNGMIARPEDFEIDGMALLRGEFVADRPVLFRRHLGTVPRDLVMGASVELLLISDHVQSILADGQFTGWSTYPVRLLDRRGADVAGYHGLVITGRSKPMDRAAGRQSMDAGDVEGLGWRSRSATTCISMAPAVSSS